jgi:hypothetical protein
MDGVKTPGIAVVLGAAGTDGVNVGCGIPGACGKGDIIIIIIMLQGPLQTQ